MTVPRFSAFDWILHPDIQSFFNLFAEAGSEARFVGSAPRDSLLGRPVHDLDVATPLFPAEGMAMLEHNGYTVKPTGVAFGTFTAFRGKRVYEVTTLREDIETDGRHAIVRYTENWDHDAQRRDLTINALYLDRKGQLYDPQGGLSDLLNGQVRFIGDPEARIQEDYLRILRFFRFSAHYGRGPLDPQGLEACRLHKQGLRGLPAERITHELFRLLDAPDPWPTLSRMENAGILGFIGEDPAPSQRYPAYRVLESVWGQAAPSLERLRALFPVCPTLSRLRLTRAQAKAWALFARNSPLFVTLGTLIAEDALSPQDGADQLTAEAHTLDKEGRFPLSGSHLLDLGLSPGPKLGELLSEARRWWVSQTPSPNLEACLEWVRTYRKDP